jgi:hypothetical protein
MDKMQFIRLKGKCNNNIILEINEMPDIKPGSSY